jgi:4-diphosphocytidyl-2-C-methyl-D-erythritol kinase
MTRRVRLRSLAKINLDLRVLNKRSDGFHELRTVFQTISLADTIEIEYERARRTVIEIEDRLKIPDNLILRSARAALDAMKISAHLRFRLKKAIPMGAGLGGGSSNAAAVLLALPVLAGRRLSLQGLTSLGSELGSDVPFFLTGGTVLASDRGTEIHELPEIAEEPILLICSGLHVATGPAYQALDDRFGGSLTSTALSRKINIFQRFVRTLGETRSASAASAFSANDFERVVFGQYPQLKTLSGKLRKTADARRMTGSGSALFGIYGSIAERDLARKVLEGDRVFRECRVMPAKLVSRRSYQRLWRKQLAEHLDPNDLIWPPQSRYER